jgi:regulator of nucleoside diphosphate kinase
VAALALQVERQQPIVAAMLLEEIERAELHEADQMPLDHVMLDSWVTFIDERTGQVREAQLVLPVNADITEGRLSILTPMGAALYGLAEGTCIEWPDRDGELRPIRVVHVQNQARPDRIECPRSLADHYGA